LRRPPGEPPTLPDTGDYPRYATHRFIGDQPPLMRDGGCLPTAAPRVTVPKARAAAGRTCGSAPAGIRSTRTRCTIYPEGHSSRGMPAVALKKFRSGRWWPGQDSVTLTEILFHPESFHQRRKIQTLPRPTPAITPRISSRLVPEGHPAHLRHRAAG